MTNDLALKNNAYVDRYSDAKDPYAAFANESGPGIQGSLLSCRKGDWGIGPDATPVKPGTRFLFIVTEIMRGWLKWADGAVVDSDMGYVRDNFIVRHRHALGDEDETQWEKDPAGNPKDPWSRSYRALLIELSPPHGDVTFSSASWGAQLALKDICGAYSAEAHLHEGAFPVVELTTKTRQNKHFGAIKGPWFEVVGWATVEDVRAGRKVGAASSKLKNGKTKTQASGTLKGEPKPDAEEELSDPLPANWGTAAK